MTRDTTLTGVWAKNALTVIPAPPLPGASYRKTTLAQEEVETGQRYDAVYDSAANNQYRYEVSSLVKDIEQHGVMRWSPLTAVYPVGAFCLAPDMKLYQCLEENGPGTGAGAREPSANAGYWLDYAASIAPQSGGFVIGKYYPFDDLQPRAGFFPVNGTWVENFDRYTQAVEYFQSPWGQARLVSLAEYEDMLTYSWHTATDGTVTSFEGKTGANAFVWDEANNRMLMPKIPGLSPEIAGWDALGVGAVRPDIQRRVTGIVSAGSGLHHGSFATGPYYRSSPSYYRALVDTPTAGTVYYDNHLATPTGPRNHGPRFLRRYLVWFGLPEVHAVIA